MIIPSARLALSAKCIEPVTGPDLPFEQLMNLGMLSLMIYAVLYLEITGELCTS